MPAESENNLSDRCEAYQSPFAPPILDTLFNFAGGSLWPPVSPVLSSTLSPGTQNTWQIGELHFALLTGVECFHLCDALLKLV